MVIDSLDKLTKTLEKLQELMDLNDSILKELDQDDDMNVVLKLHKIKNDLKCVYTKLISKSFLF